MSKQFLKAGLWIQSKKEFLARQTNFYRINYKNIRNASSKNNDNDNDDDDDLDKPIKYSTSAASTWRAAKSRNPMIDRHPHESTIVSISLIVFMLYFLVFREENDIDLLLHRDLSLQYPDIFSKQPVPRNN